MFKNGLLVLLGGCSFGVLSTFVKLAYKENYTLGEVSGVQVLFGMLILWTIFFISKITSPRKTKTQLTDKKKHPYWKLILSGFVTGTISLVYYKSVQLLPASIAIILLMQFVWISVLIEYLLYKIKPTGVQIISMVVVLAGTVLAAGFFNEQSQSLSLIGIGFGLLAGTFYALFLIINSRLGNDYPPAQKSALMLTGACILVFSIFPPYFLFNGQLSGNLWKWGLLLATFGTVIPPLFYAIGIPKIGVTLSSIISAAELPVAVGMSYFVLSEEVTGMQWLGVFIILLTIVVSNLFKRSKVHLK